MKLLKMWLGSALCAGLLVGSGGCELITSPDRSKIDATGGSGGTGGGPECTPDDGNDCTDDSCDASGNPVNTPTVAGAPCAAGLCDGTGQCVECLVAADCNDPLKTCMNGACVDVTCMDGELNGTETDTDCGGASCPVCSDGSGCADNTDCESGVCADDGGDLKCQAPTCTDTVKNGDETDIDCGGSCAPAQKCADGLGCAINEDCESGVCGMDGTCSAPSCGDGVVNQPSEACDDGNMTNGDGCDNNCTVTGCGNGQMDGTEECDDGNTTNGDGCDNNCTVTACGNGQIGGGVETCDDGNMTNGDGCDDGPGGNCTVTACGNGVVTMGEGCDDGNLTDGDGCDDGAGSNCTATACGNGIVTMGEGCDDGNLADGDGCDSNCTATACGNGIVTGGETCDDGNGTLRDGCDDGPAGNCTATACGNGVVTMGEGCDDGNLTDDDGCDSNCTLPGCGNGIVNTGETCDDGNGTTGDGCDDGPSGNCTATACGNGVVTMGEGCDDGNLTDDDGCDSNCTVTACGNDILNTGEGCDDGNTTGGDGCSATCTPENLETEPNNTCASPSGPFLVDPSVNVIGSITPTADVDFLSFTLPGPGISTIKVETFNGVVPGACPAGTDTIIELRDTNCATVLGSDDDDGLNACSLIDGSGADMGARGLPAGTYFVRVREFGDNATIPNYNVEVTILSTCGNGTTEPTELCDDGNLTDGDGCDSNCTPSACGNGIVAGTETCDDGGTTGGDGCDASCAVETGYMCTGSPSVCLGICGDGVIQVNEGCDDGNAVSGDCCSSACQLEACETEPNDTCMGIETPMPPFSLDPKIAYASGAITPSGDIDVYSFTLAKPASVKIETFTNKVGECTVDTVIELHGPSCTTLIFGDDDDGVNACSLINPASDIPARNLAAGTYFIQVEAFSGTITSYGVIVTLVDECGDGDKGSYEGCDDGNNTDGDGCSATCAVESGYACNGTTPSVCYPVAASCNALHTAAPSLPDGDYVIDPDGPGGTAQFTVHCDMTTDGGGWTLVFNDGTTFDETLFGSAAQTGYTTSWISLAYSTVPLTADIMIDASDSAISANNQELRTIITGVPGATANNTMRALFTSAGNVFYDAEDNSNVTNAGLTCGSFGKWADYEAIVCTTNVLTTNDVSPCGPTLTLGGQLSYTLDWNNCAGWPEDPNNGGTNYFPDYIRVWVR